MAGDAACSPAILALHHPVLGVRDISGAITARAGDFPLDGTGSEILGDRGELLRKLDDGLYLGPREAAGLALLSCWSVALAIWAGRKDALDAQLRADATADSE